MAQTNQFPKGDNDYEEHKLTAVNEHDDGYELMMGSLGFFVKKPVPVVPEIGQTVRVYGKFGSPVRGIFFNGQQVFYRTQAEQDKLHAEQVAASEKEKKETWEAQKDEYFAKIAALPELFQRRIKKFQDTNPDYDWKFGGYELFCCEQAWVFVSSLGTAEALQAWAKLGYEEQKAQVPELSDGHSGNTFGISVRLAWHYLTNKENVVLEHGALTPLVGCEEYGCPHADTPVEAAAK
jgi:hypothetical protein